MEKGVDVGAQLLKSWAFGRRQNGLLDVTVIG